MNDVQHTDSKHITQRNKPITTIYIGWFVVNAIVTELWALSLEFDYPIELFILRYDYVLAIFFCIHLAFRCYYLLPYLLYLSS